MTTPDPRFEDTVDAILDINGGDIGAAISLAENNRRIHARAHEAYMRYLLTGDAE